MTVLITFFVALLCVAEKVARCECLSQRGPTLNNTYPDYRIQQLCRRLNSPLASKLSTIYVFVFQKIVTATNSETKLELFKIGTDLQSQSISLLPPSDLPAIGRGVDAH
jgi:hypothetical protein